MRLESPAEVRPELKPGGRSKMLHKFTLSEGGTASLQELGKQPATKIRGWGPTEKGHEVS